MKTRLVIIFLATLGVIDTAYLTFEHFSNFVPPCAAHTLPWIDCGAVLRSQYSVVFGTPLAMFGLGYYLALLTIIFLKKNKLLPLLATAGLGASVFLFYLQLFIIKSICLYCAASGAINLVIFFIILLKIARPSLGGSKTSG